MWIPAGLRLPVSVLKRSDSYLVSVPRLTCPDTTIMVRRQISDQQAFTYRERTYDGVDAMVRIKEL